MAREVEVFFVINKKKFFLTPGVHVIHCQSMQSKNKQLAISIFSQDTIVEINSLLHSGDVVSIVGLVFVSPHNASFCIIEKKWTMRLNKEDIMVNETYWLKNLDVLTFGDVDCSVIINEKKKSEPFVPKSSLVNDYTEYTMITEDLDDKENIQTSPVLKTKPWKKRKTTPYRAQSDKINHSIVDHHSKYPIVLVTRLDDEFIRMKTSRNISAVKNNKTTRRRQKKNYKIMFTGLDWIERYKVIIKKLGGSVVDNPEEGFDVLISNEFKRTYKFLLSISMNIPIVYSGWLMESDMDGKFADPHKFILKDKFEEKKYGCNLKKLLNTPKNVFQGWTIFTTPSISPKPSEIEALVKLNGGSCIHQNWFSKISDIPKKSFTISCKKDENDYKNSPKPVLDSMFIFSAILSQKLQF